MSDHVFKEFPEIVRSLQRRLVAHSFIFNAFSMLIAIDSSNIPKAYLSFTFRVHTVVVHSSRSQHVKSIVWSHFKRISERSNLAILYQANYPKIYGVSFIT